MFLSIVKLRYTKESLIHLYFSCLRNIFFSVEIKREEDKVKQSLKDAAKKGDKATCIVLAKEVARSRKAVNKIYTAQAQIKSVGMNMTNQLGS